MATQPLVGIDTRRPKSDALYRMSMLRALEKTTERGLVLNSSAGAGKFKAARGAVPTPEFNVVVASHLPWWRRLAWRIVLVVGLIMAPLIRRWQL